jgi:hypothetical protein
VVKKNCYELMMQAFPAGSGPRDRTTYMFTYLDATPSRPSLEQMLEDYWNLMPLYQVCLLSFLGNIQVTFRFIKNFSSCFSIFLCHLTPCEAGSMLFPEKFIQLKGAVWVFRFIFLLHHVCRGIFQELYSDAQFAQFC